NVRITNVESTLELQTQMLASQPEADAIIMAAAVADYRPAQRTDSKMKKSGGDGLTLSLVQNPDVLVGLVQSRPESQIIVGFAAETGDSHHSALDYAKAKFRRKGVDLLVFNNVSEDRAFGHDDNAVQILSADGTDVDASVEFHGSKDDVSEKVIAALVNRMECVESTP
ncbi:MAG: phosphopantothenoylcysteine decarboxylase, partial [Brevibacterium aurantiacum]|nr:phosphopantothenoylcysteine decarboxylase [Brevibacterium aurantiacum]